MEPSVRAYSASRLQNYTPRSIPAVRHSAWVMWRHTFDILEASVKKERKGSGAGLPSKDAKWVAQFATRGG